MKYYIYRVLVLIVALSIVKLVDFIFGFTDEVMILLLGYIAGCICEILWGDKE